MRELGQAVSLSIVYLWCTFRSRKLGLRTTYGSNVIVPVRSGQRERARFRGEFYTDSSCIHRQLAGQPIKIPCEIITQGVPKTPRCETHVALLARFFWAPFFLDFFFLGSSKSAFRGRGMQTSNTPNSTKAAVNR